MDSSPKFKMIAGGMVSRVGDDGEKIWDRVLFYGNDDNLFYVKYAFDLPRTVGIDFNDLHGQFRGEPIPPDCVYPSFSEHLFTRAPEPLPPNTFLKRPSFLRYKNRSYDEYNTIAELLRHEALACEAIKRNPHPNLLTYFGCRVRDGRITGLHFEKYKHTLEELIELCPSRIDKKECLEGVRCGIEHLHSLGYVHNDISPGNIMIDGDGKPIIIDFDACRRIGEKVGPKFGTTGFCVLGTEICLEKNDYYSLEQLEKHLNKEVRC